MADLEKRNPGEVEYLQAVHEVLASIELIYNQNPQFEKSGIIERIVEPDRILTFKIPWVDDQGNVQVNRGYRVQFNNASTAAGPAGAFTDIVRPLASEIDLSSYGAVSTQTFTDDFTFTGGAPTNGTRFYRSQVVP